MPTVLANRPHFHFAVPGSHVSLVSVVWAALAAGLVFVALEMLLVSTVMGMSPWAPPRMIAAIALGPDVLPPPDSFDTGIVAVALGVHFVLALAYAFVFALIAKGRNVATATVLGTMFGLVLYLVNFHGFSVAFPWFAEARNWVSVFSHVVFGAVLGATYAWRANRSMTPGPSA